jgi:hypothetical protein
LQGIGTWSLLASGRYTSACITQVSYLNNTDDAVLITGATDGHLAIWTTPRGEATSQIECICTQKVHQNSIKSISTRYLTNGTSLILTSSDDNALGLTLVTVVNQAPKPLISSLVIPRAHAAAIATAKIFWLSPVRGDESKFEGRILSAANDQRIKIWDIVVDTGMPGADGVEVRKRANRYSAVADISDVGVFPMESDEKESKILVSGVGMEVWNVGCS